MGFMIVEFMSLADAQRVYTLLRSNERLKEASIEPVRDREPYEFVPAIKRLIYDQFIQNPKTKFSSHFNEREAKAN